MCFYKAIHNSEHLFHVETCHKPQVVWRWHKTD